MMLRHLPLALALPLFTSCTSHLGNAWHDGDWVVDGTHLEHERDVVLPIEAWHANGLSVDMAAGTFELIGDATEDRIELALREIEPGDASAAYVDGAIVLTSRSDEPAAIAEMRVYCTSSLAQLVVHNGAGDVIVRDQSIAGRCELELGAGDLELDELVVAGLTKLDCGVGSLDARDCELANVQMECGMGDLRLERVNAREANLEVGMGTIRLLDSELVHLSAETGMGDVRASGVRSERRHLDSGMGSVTFEALP